MFSSFLRKAPVKVGVKVKPVNLLLKYKLSGTAKSVNSQYDVAILGGGPSGIACALTLLKNANIKNDIRICLIERNKFGEKNDMKRVGECVSNSIYALLDSMGIAHILSIPSIYCKSAGHATTWASISGDLSHTDAIMQPNGYSIHLDRREFNFQMMIALKDKISKISDTNNHGNVITLFEDTIVNNLTQEHSQDTALNWKVNCVENGTERESNLSIGTIIDCTGINIPLRSHLSKAFCSNNFYIDNMVSLTRHYKMANNDDTSDRFNHAIVTECTPFGWYYSSMLPSNELVVTLICDANWLSRNQEIYKIHEWSETIEKNTKHTNSRIIECVGDAYNVNSNISQYDMRSARSHIMYPCGGSNWIACGDALCSFDPISSFGIGHALLSSITAAKVVENHFSNGNDMQTQVDQYTLDALNNYQNYLNQRKMYYKSEMRFTDSHFWNQRRNCTFSTEKLLNFKHKFM